MPQILDSGQRKVIENRLTEITKAINNLEQQTAPENRSPEHTALLKERDELWKQLDQLQ